MHAHQKVFIRVASAGVSRVGAGAASFGLPSNLSSTAGFKFRLAARVISCSVKHKVLCWEFTGGGEREKTNTHTHTCAVMIVASDCWRVQREQLSHERFVSAQLLTTLQRSDEALRAPGWTVGRWAGWFPAHRWVTFASAVPPQMFPFGLCGMK